jgi:secreted trypsin-like serine protease
VRIETSHCNAQQQLLLFAGAVLIGPRLVLGAAHCATADTRFRVGAWDGVFDGYLVDIETSIVHEDYSPSGFDHDIMLFQLKDTTPYQHIQLEKEKVTDGKFTVIGFGDTDIGPGMSLATTLNEVELNYVDNDTCDKGHGGNGFVTDDMLCAASEGKDSCVGDSGGPLLIRGETAADDRLVGLVSWGRGCAISGFAGGTTTTKEGIDERALHVSYLLPFFLHLWNRSLYPHQLLLRLD